MFESLNQKPLPSGSNSNKKHNGFELESFSAAWDRSRWPCSRGFCHYIHWEGLSLYQFLYFVFLLLLLFVFFLFFVICWMCFCFGFVAGHRGRTESIKEVSGLRLNTHFYSLYYALILLCIILGNFNCLNSVSKHLCSNYTWMIAPIYDRNESDGHCILHLVIRWCCDWFLWNEICLRIRDPGKQEVWG